MASSTSNTPIVRWITEFQTAVKKMHSQHCFFPLSSPGLLDKPLTVILDKILHSGA